LAQIEDLFHRAAECDATGRIALLDETCKSDPQLRREVEELLSHEADTQDRVQAAIDSEIHDFGFSMFGEVVSHYRILDALGSGGMGLVYKAEDLRLGRQVALKFLPEGSANDPAAIARFEREARAASALEHPNICSIYEFGEHEGRSFLVMQLLEGQTLRELLVKAKPEPSRPEISVKSPRHRVLPPDQIVDLAIQIANGLEAAHQKDIIHRDIKPANIFVTTQGQAKILDFGLAKLARGAAEDADDSEHANLAGGSNLHACEVASKSTPDPCLSRTGLAMGTAGYMSPEQARGEILDARTDLFSFGLVLYEMATGQRAFEGPALHTAILTQTPPPARQLNAALPAKLEQVITKALDKNRDTRYQTVSDMREDLETVKRQIDPRNRLRRWILVSTAVVGLLIVGTLYWLPKRQPASTTAPPDFRFRQLTINSSENPVTSGSISPHGDYLAYMDTQGIHVKDINTNLVHAIANPRDVIKDSVNWEIIGPAWFPDDIHFLANAHPASEVLGPWSSRTTDIWLFSRENGVPRRLREHAYAWSVSPDGTLISFGVNHGKFGERENWLMDPQGTQARKLFDTEENSSVEGFFWSPDSQRGLYVRTDAFGYRIMNRDIHGAPPVSTLTSSETHQDVRGDFSWLPDGRSIYQVGDPGAGYTSLQDTCNFWTLRLDAHTGKRVEEPKRLTNWTGFCFNNANATADGKRLAFVQSGGHDTAYIAELRAGGWRIRNPKHFTLEEAYDAIDDWTADSKTVILIYNRGDHYGLYKQNLNSDTPEPIVASGAGGLLEEAVVSPDGKWVITQFYPIPGGPSEPNKIMRVPIDGGVPEVIFTVREGSVFGCTRGPTGLCAVGEQSTDREHMVITAFDPMKGRGSELARLDLDPAFDGKANLLWSISPDGTRIASAKSPHDPIIIRSLRGGPVQTIRAEELTRILGVGAWAADGKSLFVSNGVKGGIEIVHVGLNGKTQVVLKSNGPQGTATPSPDGRHLAINTFQLNSNMWMIENF
jgi:serine/threonine protein kinase